MNQLTRLLGTKQRELLSVYFVAGFPGPDSTVPVLKALAAAGVDFVEIGMPFSDPMADGPVIQEANARAIENGMHLGMLLARLEEAPLRIPVLLMGYLNPVLRYGMERFCRDAARAGVSGVILPDLPVAMYNSTYRKLFEAYGLHMIFLVTPSTSEARIREIDAQSTAFIYAVSASATTGVRGEDDQGKLAYFRRLKAMNLTHPFMVGFGIQDPASLAMARTHAAGAIVGTAFIRALMESPGEEQAVHALFRQLGIQNT